MFKHPELGDLLLEPVAQVVAAIAGDAPSLNTSDIMLIGAQCRDMMHAGLGHAESLRATHDLDLALAVRTWEGYDQIVMHYTPTGTNQIRFMIADIPVDLMAFGEIENPDGISHPPPRKEDLIVWAFKEIHEHSESLSLTNEIAIRIPKIPGYAAAKIGAWVDRAPIYEYKDAEDLQQVLRWYSESEIVEDRIFLEAQDLFEAEEYDLSRTAARLLARDVRKVVSDTKLFELKDRWDQLFPVLLSKFRPRGMEPKNLAHFRATAEAFNRGLWESVIA